MSTPSTLTYTVFDSFTSKRFRGNPAAVILIDKPLLDHQYIEIAREFNLSQTGFVLLPSDEPSKDPQSKSFGIRWFTKKNEIALCGHVTLAAARLLFDEPKLVPSLTNVLRFNSLSGELTARRVGDSDIELEFPAGKLREVDREYVAKTQGVVNRALEKEAKVLYVGEGLGESFGKFLLIELEETARLEGAEIESQFLLELLPHALIILTAKSTNPEFHFVSRLFPPMTYAPEDPVTGSAHCLLGPYWTKRLGLAKGSILSARQVSERGGEMDVIWDQETETCKLRGKVQLVARGKMFLDD